jgi:hypothetical protein
MLSNMFDTLWRTDLDGLKDGNSQCRRCFFYRRRRSLFAAPALAVGLADREGDLVGRGSHCFQSWHREIRRAYEDDFQSMECWSVGVLEL